jgi:hypothetical protein
MSAPRRKGVTLKLTRHYRHSQSHCSEALRVILTCSSESETGGRVESRGRDGEQGSSTTSADKRGLPSNHPACTIQETGATAPAGRGKE